MKQIKSSLVVLAGMLAVIGLVTFFIPSLTQGQPGAPPTELPPPQNVTVVNSPSQPVPVTGTISVGSEPVPVTGTVNVGNEAVPVTGTVSVGNVVQFQPAISVGAFSKRFLFGSGLWLISGPDPAGTSYAITSLTLANVNDNAANVITYAGWSDTDCTLNPTHFQHGPVVQLRANETVHLSFPQPFVFAAQPGASSCLVIGITHPNIATTVVGYRF